MGMNCKQHLTKPVSTFDSQTQPKNWVTVYWAQILQCVLSAEGGFSVLVAQLTLLKAVTRYKKPCYTSLFIYTLTTN